VNDDLAAFEAHLCMACARAVGRRELDDVADTHRVHALESELDPTAVCGQLGQL